MTLFNQTGNSSASIINQVQMGLVQLRNAFGVVGEMQKWADGVTQDDLVGLGMSTADAAGVLSAIADANAMKQIYDTGQAPDTYPQVSAPYVYGDSQRRVIGPRIQ